MTATFHDLADASVFITGGGTGIGAALTAAFCAQGAKVAFVDFVDAAGFVDELGATAAHPPLFTQCDVTDTSAMHDAMDRAADAHGPFKAVVNNAANDMRYDVAAVTPDIWDDMQAVNLKAYFFSCQKAAERMAAKGSIINYSSTSYMLGMGNLVPYTTANAGISGMTRSLARAFGPKGIRVNAIAPGWVMTEKQLALWAEPKAKAAHLDRQCLAEFMQPEDMVGGTLFLASDASAMMTGQTIVIDGGVVTTG
ncbi:SDR family NAD(P)-dependent oxidoreductase [Yoonia sediminilitoris]|uniref:NAD(P)-dependent dehydrogenase (Short-subunit alcohol dehydrogenase family) n=1 Tax=Yoonia sediminilitoris TaxID=1286148 RepID=A0A2T6K7J4_9RHOB|nr:SDR family oxidoreductase [Yoonia sediminilitoris]PUB10689.1 NAD(P)-dependent dehydrogenase (short-subunit alcohol dehydrogenase family) [Yoonia sediminilitoris]RCW90441.1 NAD(P)-dependent dehydrogenase (short-subunit alcohol dehydrogenase family) [Yoonia sediminilitoris]